MIDYQALYLKLFGATEDAIKILVEAQQECEELYLKQSDDEGCPPAPNEVEEF